MQQQCVRPVLWWRGGRLRVRGALADACKQERWQMQRLGYVVFHVTQGDSMSDDQSSALRLVTPPASEPVTLSQAKAFLRIEHNGDDAAITTAIMAARVAAEQYLRMVLLAQSWEFSAGNPCCVSLALPVRPVTSISAVTLVNEQGATRTLESGDYRASVAGDAVLFANSLSSEIVRVQFVAGAYADAASIPAPIIQGILHHVAAMMEVRDGSAGLPVQALSCYAPYRQVSL